MEIKIVEDEAQGYAVFVKFKYFWQQRSKWYVKRGWAERKIRQIKEAYNNENVR